jgi:H+/Cl- antiporter ClcA
MFAIYVALILFSLFCIIFRKKRELRDFGYVIIGVFAALCFVHYLPHDEFLNHIMSDGEFRARYFPLLFHTVALTCWTRVTVWLFKWWQAKRVLPDEGEQFGKEI